MKTARAHRKFAIYSIYLDTWLEGEEDIQDGETRKQVMKRILTELEETAKELRTEAESMRGQIITETIQGAKREFPPIGPGMPQHVPVISKAIERAEIAIDNAETIADLQLLKGEAEKYGLENQYVKRFNELNNGRPTEFTDGL
jgi:hypothetical protein